MDELTKTIATRGDLAHLALFLCASGVLVSVMSELARANQRFEDFVKEIAALNRLGTLRADDCARWRVFRIRE
jgi:hypothetical protein